MNTPRAGTLVALRGEGGRRDCLPCLGGGTAFGLGFKAALLRHTVFAAVSQTDFEGETMEEVVRRAASSA
ncbi:hypothetical protein E2C01_034226 [Portunus trituberculatus]|uniref:Uncharacterized protein n=1 Tax=Portunus trituberculatus TaxID=210409 RepID=A0A5B7F0W5_PORTR|nr:hypothetical protein [Portunus trituberculatus]